MVDEHPVEQNSVRQAQIKLRRRRPLVRVVVALTSATALLAVVVIVTTAAIVPPIGARRIAREGAEREIQFQLTNDEKVLAKTFASQRKWTDVWRESFGILVATDRRVLYVGAPPTPLLRPEEDGPAELIVESFPYDAAFTIEPNRMLGGALRGLRLRTPLTTISFVVHDAEWADALAVSQESSAARAAVTRADQQLSEMDRVAPTPAARYVTHVVKRGETLTGLAVRYDTSIDVLRQLNHLQSDGIRSGQRLRVPEVSSSDRDP